MTLWLLEVGRLADSALKLFLFSGTVYAGKRESGRGISLDRRRVLLSFIRLLEERGILRFDPDSLDSRLRLQKYVYLARPFGLRLGYGFSLYIRGPYSPDLARDYYDLPEGGDSLPAEFKAEEFIEFVRDRDERWLEAASTLLMLAEESPDDLEWVISRGRELKPWAGEEWLRGILEEIRRRNLIPVTPLRS